MARSGTATVTGPTPNKPRRRRRLPDLGHATLRQPDLSGDRNYRHTPLLRGLVDGEPTQARELSRSLLVDADQLGGHPGAGQRVTLAPDRLELNVRPPAV
jgi:plasmid stabilization system protein ParE